MRRVIIFNNEPDIIGETMLTPPAGRVSVSQATMKSSDRLELKANAKSCRKAVESAYWSMIYLGCSDSRAFRVADRIFQWHRPMASDFDRQARLRCWIDGNSMQ
jgi:hypothetical protein